MGQKIILTGAPGCGKSVIILALEQRGEQVVRESAEDFIRLQQAHGHEKPWTEPGFQDGILKLQLQREANAPAAARLFYDRSVLDIDVFYRFRNEQPSPEFVSLIEKTAYHKVFLVENLGNCERNKVRKETFEEALTIEKMLHERYKEAGYDVIVVPKGSVHERTAFILERC